MVRYVSAYVQYNQAYQKLKRVELGTDSFTPDVIMLRSEQPIPSFSFFLVNIIVTITLLYRIGEKNMCIHWYYWFATADFKIAVCFSYISTLLQVA